ncbi:branched-chain amino acid ABC transporter substrate-binding protein [Actinocorallia sp. API 0066]|uniref:branched-chain amino acid ABC transporter substrate-binding protein n=1 Tax=Actinocorallia sp. API 0066 TaxID=2896846 RepID=UPI001E3B3493|nr:branched-chain amino acid ABC transporter substrate-binding protein [Actinocorallia sp. API 0066]MCD0448760.1 branched-chain amino acid ABC transporter substrate-binding protein [Actinocorallia sp. API 0066]
MKLGTSALRLIAMAGVASLALTACGGEDSGGGGDVSEVSIGVMGDFTGENSGIVLPIKNAVQLAIDNYNATSPETKIVLKEYDSQAKPEQATALAKKAIKEDKIVGLVGPAFSGESAQVGPVLEEAGIPSVSASATNAALAENGWKYWHRVIADDDVQGAGLGAFITTGLAAKKVFVVDDKSTYGQPLGATVKASSESGGASTQTDSIDIKASDYSSTVNKVKAFAPDAIFFAGYYAQGGKLLKQLREAGVTGKFLSADGSLDPGLAKGAGTKNADGALIGCPCLIDPEGTAGDASKTFAEAYKAKFNASTAIYSAEAYDAATVFINAIKAGKVTPEDINTWIATADFAGVSKQIKFQENGEIAADDVYIYKVTGETLPLLGNAKTVKDE